MGGINEKVLTPSPKSQGNYPSSSSGGSPGAGLNVSKGSIRIHENKGEVHFHDDTAAIKVGVPVAEFMKQFLAWKDAPSAPLILVDHVRGTTARLEMRSIAGEMDIDYTLEKAKFGKNFQSLLDFAEGK